MDRTYRTRQAHLDDVVSCFVGAAPPQPQSWSVLARLVALHGDGLKAQVRPLQPLPTHSGRSSSSFSPTHGLLKVIQFFTLFPNLSKHRLAKSLKWLTMVTFCQPPYFSCKTCRKRQHRMRAVQRCPISGQNTASSPAAGPSGTG